MDIVEAFSEIENFRHPQGRRYPLAPMLLIVKMSIARGYPAYREIERFAKANFKRPPKMLVIIDSYRISIFQSLGRVKFLATFKKRILFCKMSKLPNPNTTLRRKQTWRLPKRIASEETNSL